MITCNHTIPHPRLFQRQLFHCSYADAITPIRVFCNSPGAIRRQKPAASRYLIDPSPRIITLRLMRHQSGFTLIELVVTISVAAILMALAVPSFRSTIQNNRVTGQANEFVTSLTLARSEAIKRGRNATVCISSDGTSCTGSNWAGGWLVWVDSNGDGVLGAGETVRVHEALPNGSTLTEAGG